MDNNIHVDIKKKNIDYDKKILEVVNLKKHFLVGSGKNKFNVKAVDDISFDVYKREVFGIVGESGSGKTTAGRTIIKLYKPTEGTVRLNDFKIIAGHMEYVRNIRHIKRNLTKDLIQLNPIKREKEKLKQEEIKEIKKVKRKIEENELNYQEKLFELNFEVNEYKTNVYNLKEQRKFELDTLKYDLTMEKERLLNKSKNIYLEKYQEKVKIEKTKFKNKYNGLKDSAALLKTEIDRRIQQLRDEHDNDLKELRNEYKDLIIKGDSEAVTLNIVKEEIKTITEDYKKERNRIIEESSVLLEKLEIPNKIKYIKDKKALDNMFKILKVELQNQIKDIKLKYKDIKSELHSNKSQIILTNEEKETIKIKARELRAKAKEDIRSEKVQIALAKEINNSKEALEASRKMQMIFQDPISSLNPRMTVREIIGEGLIISKKFTKKEINDKVAEILEIVGLAPEYAMRYPHEFSGGQRQRIGIARALIMQPNFIIADEPISALDVSIQAQVINLISELKEVLDLTVLFIAHDLSVVKFFCDRVAVMHNGKIVELADTTQLFENPVHPYTKSLLSAIPRPDPDYEKGRKRTHYNPLVHNYRVDKPEMREVRNGHYVYINDEEYSKFLKENKEQVK